MSPGSVAHISDLMTSESVGPVVPTFGVPSLDEAVGPVPPGSLVVIGGHPGAPSDALALYAALTAARRKVPTLIVTPGTPRGALTRWLVSTSGAPLDELWDPKTLPAWLGGWLRRDLVDPPLFHVDGIGAGVAGVAAALEEMPVVPGCVVVLGARWLDPHRHLRLILFDLKKLAFERGLVLVADVDTRFPGPNVISHSPRPDGFDDAAIVALADVCLLLAARRAYELGVEQFDVSVVGSLTRRSGVIDLVIRDRTMRIDESASGLVGVADDDD